MLFLLFIILFIIGILLSKKFEFTEGFNFINSLVVLFSGIGIIFSLITIISNYITINSYIEVNKERYNAIMYKVESNICHDELGLLNKEVIDEIQEWNEELTFYQTVQNDFWIGIYIPNVYDEFQIIDYKMIEE